MRSLHPQLTKPKGSAGLLALVARWLPRPLGPLEGSLLLLVSSGHVILNLSSKRFSPIKVLLSHINLWHCLSRPTPWASGWEEETPTPAENPIDDWRRLSRALSNLWSLIRHNPWPQLSLRMRKGRRLECPIGWIAVLLPRAASATLADASLVRGDRQSSCTSPGDNALQTNVQSVRQRQQLAR